VQVLVVNAGSSSLKLRVLDRANQLLRSEDLPPLSEGSAYELERFLTQAQGVQATGHRVVHGGPEFHESVIVTDEVLSRLEKVSDLAPLHNPPALRGIEAVRHLLPDLPTVACFDTSFHSTLPDQAAYYALPWRWTQQLGIRKYGFHGLSHAYASRRSAEIVGRRVDDLRIVTCHLGSGASLAAVASGMSVDTTMGFTPLDGLVMGTRPGHIDPGAILWAQTQGHLTPTEVGDALETGAGLLGVSGVSGDMRAVLEAADRGDHQATLATSIYLHRLRGLIAAMAAAMGGVDVLAFTGGVGENSARIRHDACEGLAFLGVEVNAARNETAGDGDVDVSTDGAAVRTVVVHAREDIEIAREVRLLLGSRSGERS
jgi:acetate kinase